MTEPGSFVWTRRQRAVLASLVLILCAVFFVRALRNPTHVDDPAAPTGDLAQSLATRIDPNTADWPAWAALPLIGEAPVSRGTTVVLTTRTGWHATTGFYRFPACGYRKTPRVLGVV